MGGRASLPSITERMRACLFCLPLCLSLAGAPAPLLAPLAAAPGASAPSAVDSALERGVAWVLDEQRPDGGFGAAGDSGLGASLLAALALQHAGLREDGTTPQDRRLARTLALVDRLGPGRGASDRDPGTYTSSLLAMVLRARGRPADRLRMERVRDLLVRTQADNGQWGYSGQPGESGRSGPEVGDHSNTQFALLALGALAAEGVECPPEPLARARAWWLSAQGTDGGFGYASGGARASAPSASMTAAAIACLAVLRALGEGPDAEIESALARSFAWLAEDFSVEKNRGPAQGGVGERQRNAGRGWLHYYLWTLERACVLAERERVGDGHDWFALGTQQLLSTQKKDGSWVGEAPLYATCFALLFLSRAADPPRVFTARPRSAPAVTPSGPAPGTSPAPPAPSEPSLGPADPRAVPPLAPEELLRRARTEGPSSLKRLTLALEDPDPAVRRRAHEALVALLAPEQVEGVAERPLPRNRLLLWIQRHRQALRVHEGRFVLGR